MKTLLITILLFSTIILVWCGNNEIKQEVVINTWTITKEVVSSWNLIDIWAVVEQFKNNTWIIDNNEVIGTWITDINKDIVKISGIFKNVGCNLKTSKFDKNPPNQHHNIRAPTKQVFLWLSNFFYKNSPLGERWSVLLRAPIGG